MNEQECRIYVQICIIHILCTWGVPVWVIFEGILPDEIHILEELFYCAILVKVNLRENGWQIHRILDHISIIWYLVHSTKAVVKRDSKRQRHIKPAETFPSGNLYQITAENYLFQINRFCKSLEAFILGEAVGDITEEQTELSESIFLLLLQSVGFIFCQLTWWRWRGNRKHLQRIEN